MDKAKLKAQLEALSDEYEKKKTSACIEYCKANNKVSVGDKITSRHGESILVDKITFSMGWRSDSPECIYHGLELKKDLTERKDKRRSVIHQSNLMAEKPNETII